MRLRHQKSRTRDCGGRRLMLRPKSLETVWHFESASHSDPNRNYSISAAKGSSSKAAVLASSRTGHLPEIEQLLLPPPQIALLRRSRLRPSRDERIKI